MTQTPPITAPVDVSLNPGRPSDAIYTPCIPCHVRLRKDVYTANPSKRYYWLDHLDRSVDKGVAANFSREGLLNMLQTHAASAVGTILTSAVTMLFFKKFNPTGIASVATVLAGFGFEAGNQAINLLTGRREETGLKKLILDGAYNSLLFTFLGAVGLFTARLGFSSQIGFLIEAAALVEFEAGMGATLHEKMGYPGSSFAGEESPFLERWIYSALSLLGLRFTGSRLIPMLAMRAIPNTGGLQRYAAQSVIDVNRAKRLTLERMPFLGGRNTWSESLSYVFVKKEEAVRREDAWYKAREIAHNELKGGIELDNGVFLKARKDNPATYYTMRDQQEVAGKLHKRLTGKDAGHDDIEVLYVEHHGAARAGWIPVHRIKPLGIDVIPERSNVFATKEAAQAATAETVLGRGSGSTPEIVTMQDPKTRQFRPLSDVGFFEKVMGAAHDVVGPLERRRAHVHVTLDFSEAAKTHLPTRARKKNRGGGMEHSHLPEVNFALRIDRWYREKARRGDWLFRYLPFLRGAFGCFGVNRTLLDYYSAPYSQELVKAIGRSSDFHDRTLRNRVTNISEALRLDLERRTWESRHLLREHSNPDLPVGRESPGVDRPIREWPTHRPTVRNSHKYTSVLLQDLLGTHAGNLGRVEVRFGDWFPQSSVMRRYFRVIEEQATSAWYDALMGRVSPHPLLTPPTGNNRHGRVRGNG